MQKIYLLLRNNQQSGPHSIEELQELSLLPTDLIWTEGKIGWKSPGEIPGLSKEEKIPVTPVISPKAEYGNNKISASKIFVKLPGNRQVVTANSQEDLTVIDPAIALEQKAEALYQKIQAFQEQQAAAPKEELETKYTRSLEDIKNEYAGWLNQKKNSKQFNGKPIWAAATLIVLLIAGFFLFRTDESGTAVIAEIKPTGTAAITGEFLPVSNTAPVTKKQPIAARNKKPVAKNKTGKPVHKTNPVTVSPKPTPRAANSTSIPELVTVNGRYKPVGRGVSSSEITLHNRSYEHLKVVAVDVIYYRPNGSVLARQTIYFRNIDPQTSLTLKAPANEKADEVKYKMGLISASESGLYYAMN